MWVFLVVLVFILVLSTGLRRRREQAHRIRRRRRVIAVLPIVQGVHGAPAVVMAPGDRPVRLTFGGKGLRRRDAKGAGMERIKLCDGVIKMPVNLAREEAEYISALDMGPDVQAVTLDFGTRQMILHDKEKHDGAEFTFTKEGNGNVFFHPVAHREEWSRIGKVGANLDKYSSRGSMGKIRCGNACLSVNSSEAPDHNTVLGWKDLTKGKHRFVFNLKSKTAVVQ